MSVLQNASQRTHHFSSSILWFQQQLISDEKFQTTFKKMVDAVCRASVDNPASHAQIHFVAIGKSAGVARLAVSMLVSVGIRANFIHATEAFHGDFGTIRNGDSIVCISAGGKTVEIIDLVPHLRSRQCEVFAITSALLSPLAEAADFTLPIPSVVESCPLEQAPLTSTITTLALCQLVVAASVEERTFELASYARNHPGGSIGKRIYMRVDDCLNKSAPIPTVTLIDSFQTCISKMTMFAKAGLLVVDHNMRFFGLIAERELRVAMEAHQAKVFDLTAKDLMNEKPISTTAETLAVDALRLMQSRPRPLNILPVVDPQKHQAIGLLHIHDLVAKGISLD